MNSTKARRSAMVLRGILLATIAALLIGGFPGLGIVQASSDWPIIASLGESVAAQQQSSDKSGLPWLFAVFFITWAAFFGYVFIMSRRQREMRREIEALKRALADRDGEMAQTGHENEQ